MGRAAPLVGGLGDEEYTRSSHSNVRIRARLVTMGRAWDDRPGEILPVIFPGEAEQGDDGPYP